MTYDNNTASTADAGSAGSSKDQSSSNTDPVSSGVLERAQQDVITGTANSANQSQIKLNLNPSLSTVSASSPESSGLFAPNAGSETTNAFLGHHPEAPRASSSESGEEGSGQSTSSDDLGLGKLSMEDEAHDPLLDEEIRNRLDRLNALSDLINKLELQFDQKNALFRETLKCSTERLSNISKNLGPKYLRQGRVYHAAKLSVEQTQADCQRACVQFEQANNDHQYAKLAIKEAESKLHQVNCSVGPDASTIGNVDNVDTNGLVTLENENGPKSPGFAHQECDRTQEGSSSEVQGAASPPNQNRSGTDSNRLMNSAKLSEDLNKAIVRLVEAEERRRQSEILHLDHANKLMIAQENLTRLEREHGASIRRAQIYFDEAKRFNAKLNSVKNDIDRVSENIVAAKKAYAETLSDLEQFSEDLHINGRKLINPVPVGTVPEKDSSSCTEERLPSQAMD